MSATAGAPHRASPLTNFDTIQPLVDGAPGIGLFLDFDGTLSPIVANPEKAEIDRGLRKALEKLIEREDFQISIVSGRALSDLRERAGLSNVIYAGNHGLEIESDDTCFREPQAEALRRELKCVALQLRLALSETEGLEIEDKGLTLAVHFRRVTEHLHDWVRSVTHSTVGRSQYFVCHEGKMVLDVKPQIKWNKGHAVKWIAKEVLRRESLAIYIGDDVTDEDAFEAVSDGITIKVGESAETKAQYFVPDVPAVGQFLNWLYHAKPHASLANIQRTGR